METQTTGCQNHFLGPAKQEAEEEVAAADLRTPYWHQSCGNHLGAKRIPWEI
jgi:hypothetical protein